MAHLIEPRIYFGAADGSEGFYTPITSTIRLVSITRSLRRSAARTIPRYGRAWAGVPAKSAAQVTPIDIVLSIQQTYTGAVQDFIDYIEQYVGGSNANQPRDLWYSDDALSAVTTDNIETQGSSKQIEYTGTPGFTAGDYVFYPSGDPVAPDEVVVVDSVHDSAGYFIADLQNGHYASQSVFKFRWCYPKARLDRITPSPSSTGRTRITLSMLSEGEPLNGTSLPS